VKLRVSAVDLMLLGVVLVRALDLTVTRYVLMHGIRIVPTAVGLERLHGGFRLAALVASADVAAIARVGPVLAPLFASIRPFLAVVFALVLLSEQLDRWEIAGGIAIGLGNVLDRRRNGVPEPAVLGGMPAE
jgi:hypothetical protein